MKKSHINPILVRVIFSLLIFLSYQPRTHASNFLNCNETKECLNLVFGLGIAVSAVALYKMGENSLSKEAKAYLSEHARLGLNLGMGEQNSRFFRPSFETDYFISKNWGFDSSFMIQSRRFSEDGIDKNLDIFCFDFLFLPQIFKTNRHKINGGFGGSYEEFGFDKKKTFQILSSFDWTWRYSYSWGLKSKVSYKFNRSGAFEFLTKFIHLNKGKKEFGHVGYRFVHDNQFNNDTHFFVFGL